MWEGGAKTYTSAAETQGHEMSHVGGIQAMVEMRCCFALYTEYLEVLIWRFWRVGDFGGLETLEG